MHILFYKFLNAHCWLSLKFSQYPNSEQCCIQLTSTFYMISFFKIFCHLYWSDSGVRIITSFFRNLKSVKVLNCDTFTLLFWFLKIFILIRWSWIFIHIKLTTIFTGVTDICLHSSKFWLKDVFILFYKSLNAHWRYLKQVCQL